MKKIQSLALILGSISFLINIYALFSLILGFTPELPKIFWSLHIGVFICFAPAISVRTNRLKREKGGNDLGSQDSIKAMWEGIPMIPFRILTIYAFLAIIYQGVILDNQTVQAQPWLPFSVGWMAFYYISWAMLRNEQSYKVAA
ncbi:MAG: hypothetical protein JJ966_05870 [Balneolaceae bacterium]|nr:hypothetical protein [Balneolaceae bacterium]